MRSDNDFSYRPQQIPIQSLVKFAVVIVPAVVILAMLASCFYMVSTDEKGVVLRFGKFVRITEPGLHLKLPLGIERVFTPPVERIFKEEFGFRTLKAGVKTTYRPGKMLEESLMLCGDLSVAEVEWIVQYKIREPDKFLFMARNQTRIIRDVAEAVMRTVVGDSSIDEVLSSRRVEISDECQVRMQEILNNYDVGVRITTVKLQDVNPPEEVKPAFNEVNAAQQDKERLINMALEEYNKVIPRARGQAKREIEEAEAYAINRTNVAKGDASRFIQIHDEYKRSKDVTRRRLYLEAMQKVLPKIKTKYIIDDQIQSLLPLLDLKEK